MDPEWLDLTAFVRDMGHPKAGQTLDRIDNTDHYYAENCRWACKKTQARNRSSNIVITHRGVTAPAIYFAERYGLKSGTLYMRIRRGVPKKLWFVKDIKSHLAR